ncbi:unnamed protein product [Rhizophagus irregularis]|uniref:Uncharacterized protein n=1 Tax=Rhizophagus irregularis TaxID=588596 RepID=A0A916E1E8_9GLOM|nr:unnamed protein product [Rhizophagus irregularis]
MITRAGRSTCEKQDINHESKMSSSSTIAERQEFKEFEMGLRPALELEDYIKKLYDRKARVNLEDVRVKK